jgi:hypothetical protein
MRKYADFSEMFGPKAPTGRLASTRLPKSFKMPELPNPAKPLTSGAGVVPGGVAGSSRTPGSSTAGSARVPGNPAAGASAVAGSPTPPSKALDLINDTGTASTYAPHVSAAAKSGLSPLANQAGAAASRIPGSAPAAALGRQAASAVSKSTAGKVLGHVVGKAALPVAVAAESIGVGSDIYNKGWQQTTNDNAQKLRNIAGFKDGWHTLYQAPLQVLNPVQNVQTIAGGITEAGLAARDIGRWAGSSLYNWARGK